LPHEPLASPGFSIVGPRELQTPVLKIHWSLHILPRILHLLGFGVFHLWRGLSFRGAGASRTPLETVHKSVPPILPAAWNAFSFCICCSHSFPSI
jgi:hypothetical protein